MKTVLESMLVHMLGDWLNLELAGSIPRLAAKHQKGKEGGRMDSKGGTGEIYEVQERPNADKTNGAGFRKGEVACKMAITACEGFKSACERCYSIVRVIRS